MNTPPKPTGKQTVSALIIGFLAGYLTRLSQRTRRADRVSRRETFIRSVLAELRRGE